MNELRYNRLLPPILLLAALASAAGNTLLQKLSGIASSFPGLALIFILSFLSALGVFALLWAVAARWPRAGGALMLLVYITIGIASFRASLTGSFPDDPGLRVLFLASTALYAAVGLMALSGKKRNSPGLAAE